MGGVLCGRGLDSSGDVLVYTRNLASLARDMGVDIRSVVSFGEAQTKGKHQAKSFDINRGE